MKFRTVLLILYWTGMMLTAGNHVTPSGGEHEYEYEGYPLD